MRVVEVGDCVFEAEIVRVQYIVAGGERHRPLPVVARARVGVARLDLQPFRETTVQRQNERVVGRVHVVGDPPEAVDFHVLFKPWHDHRPVEAAFRQFVERHDIVGDASLGRKGENVAGEDGGVGGS